MSDTKLTAKEWLEKNITLYTDRQKLFDSCVENTGGSRKTVQQIYKTVFMPKLHKRDNYIIEDNREPKENSDELNILKMENSVLLRNNQRLEDAKKRMENQLRELLRGQNNLEDFEKDLVNSIKLYNPVKPYSKTHVISSSSPPIGIVQLSDLHFNEEIDIPGNKYNFDVAGKRLAKFSRLTRRLFNSYKIEQIVIAMTGDLVNSDRLPDEFMTNTYNRTDAICVSVGILRQFIESFLEDFSISVCAVAGNESRLQKDWNWTKKLASDNFDCFLFKMLSMFHTNCPNIKYIFGNIIEEVMKINGQTVVFTHGYKAGSNPLSFAANVRSRFAAKNILTDFIISGHKHNPDIGDFFGVSGSLSGGNTFGEYSLNKSCRASQNVYIVHKDSGIDGIRLDLQDGDSTGYIVDKETLENDIKTISKDIELITTED